MKKVIMALLMTTFFSMNANAFWSFSKTKKTTRTSCTVGICTIETCVNNSCSYEKYDDPDYEGSPELADEFESDMEKLISAGVSNVNAESVAALASQDLIDVDAYIKFAQEMSHLDAMLEALTK